MYLGDFNLNATVNTRFNTITSTGAPSSLTGAAMKVYKDNSSVASTGAFSLTADFVYTGNNMLSVQTSLDTGYFVGGSDYAAVLSSGTVNSVSVAGYTVCQWSMLNRSPLRPATAGRTLNVSSSGIADANVAQINGATASTATAQLGVSVINYASGQAPLQPTVAGRTFNVSASGIGDANLAQIIASTISTSVAQLAVQTIGSSLYPTNFAAMTIASSGAVNGTVDDKTGFALTAAYDAAKTAATTGSAMTLTAAYDAAKTAATTGSAMTLTSAYNFAKGTVAMAESYAANGAAPTPIQAVFAMHQRLMGFAQSSTHMDVLKLDHATTAFVVTYDSTAPTLAQRL